MSPRGPFCVYCGKRMTVCYREVLVPDDLKDESEVVGWRCETCKRYVPAMRAKI